MLVLCFFAMVLSVVSSDWNHCQPPFCWMTDAYFDLLYVSRAILHGASTARSTVRRDRQSLLYQQRVAAGRRSGALERTPTTPAVVTFSVTDESAPHRISGVCCAWVQLQRAGFCPRALQLPSCMQPYDRLLLLLP